MTWLRKPSPQPTIASSHAAGRQCRGNDSYGRFTIRMSLRPPARARTRHIQYTDRVLLFLEEDSGAITLAPPGTGTDALLLAQISRRPQLRRVF